MSHPLQMVTPSLRETQTDSPWRERSRVTPGQQRQQQQLTTADRLSSFISSTNGQWVNICLFILCQTHTHMHTHNFPMEVVSHVQVGCYLGVIVQDSTASQQNNVRWQWGEWRLFHLFLRHTQRHTMRSYLFISPQNLRCVRATGTVVSTISI